MQSQVKGSFFLALGAFVSKILGAVYRIPLFNILGATGMGLYQMIFPIYCILLDFAGVGVPSAISKLISSNNEINYDKKILKSSIKLLTVLGGIFSIFMLVFSYPISLIQGNENALLGYIFLSPSVIIVAIISCYRGYFQGKMNMTPTAVSQIIEQSVKLIFGITLTILFSGNIVIQVAMATLSVTISEIFSLLYIFTKYKKERSEKIIVENKEIKGIKKSIIKIMLPVTIISIMIPFSQFIDSIMVINILKTYTEKATSLYGLYSGSALTIISLPISLLYGISVVTIPSASKVSGTNREKVIQKSLLFTFIFALIFMLFTIILSDFVVGILYRNLSLEDKKIVSYMVKLLSTDIIMLSLLQTENSCLISKGKTNIALISLIVGVSIKIILNFILLPIKNINIYGVCFSTIACYFIVCLINLIVISIGKVEYENKTNCYRQLSN